MCLLRDIRSLGDSDPNMLPYFKGNVLIPAFYNKRRGWKEGRKGKAEDDQEMKRGKRKAG